MEVLGVKTASVVDFFVYLLTILACYAVVSLIRVLIHAQEEPSRVRSQGVCGDNEVEKKEKHSETRGCRLPQT